MFSFGGGHGMGTIVRERRIRARPAESAIATDRGGRLSELVQPRRLWRLRQSVRGLRSGIAGIRGRFLSSTSTNLMIIILREDVSALFVFSPAHAFTQNTFFYVFK